MIASVQMSSLPTKPYSSAEKEKQDNSSIKETTHTVAKL